MLWPDTQIRGTAVCRYRRCHTSERCKRMSAYEPLVVGSFMRRSASATSTSALASEQLIPQMEAGTKLQSRSVHSVSAPHKAQLPRFHSNGHSPASSWRGACQPNLWLVVAILVVCSVSLYAFSLTRGVSYRPRLQKPSNGYGIVIDAGSSGSRIHVYKYSGNNGRIPQVDLKHAVTKKVTPGLSSFAVSEPESAGESLLDLLDFAKSKIPSRDWAATPVYLMATAGLRLVESAIRERILDSCREFLRRSAFSFEDPWASVISGPDEGKFAWVAANYVLGKLGHDARDTYGIVELGGASAQVTFVPDTSPPKDYLVPIELGGVTYNLYTQSFLKLGQEAAFQAMLQLLCSGVIQSPLAVERGTVVDPCTPRGYEGVVEGIAEHTSVCAASSAHHAVLPGPQKAADSAILSGGNYTECRRVALSLLQHGGENCKYKPKCAIGSHFIPSLTGKFFGTENFFYTSQFFGLPATATLKDIQAAGQHYCEQEWSVLQQQHPKISKADLLKYCFSTSYIVALLRDSLGFDMEDTRITFTNEVGDVSLDWALGALIVRMGEGTRPPAGRR